MGEPVMICPVEGSTPEVEVTRLCGGGGGSKPAPPPELTFWRLLCGTGVVGIIKGVPRGNPPGGPAAGRAAWFMSKYLRALTTSSLARPLFFLLLLGGGDPVETGEEAEPPGEALVFLALPSGLIDRFRDLFFAVDPEPIFPLNPLSWAGVHGIAVGMAKAVGGGAFNT